MQNGVVWGSQGSPEVSEKQSHLTERIYELPLTFHANYIPTVTVSEK